MCRCETRWMWWGQRGVLRWGQEQRKVVRVWRHILGVVGGLGGWDRLGGIGWVVV